MKRTVLCQPQLCHLPLFTAEASAECSLNQQPLRPPMLNSLNGLDHQIRLREQPVPDISRRSMQRARVRLATRDADQPSGRTRLLPKAELLRYLFCDNP